MTSVLETAWLEGRPARNSRASRDRSENKEKNRALPTMPVWRCMEYLLSNG
jgi:hypothetical protein